MRTNVLNRIAKFDEGRLYQKEENLSFNNNYMIKEL